jgi:hypothetical protein
MKAYFLLFAASTEHIFNAILDFSFLDYDAFQAV